MAPLLGMATLISACCHCWTPQAAQWPKQITPVTASVHTLAKSVSNDADENIVGAGGASSGAGIRGAISGVAPAGPGPPPDRQEDYALLA